MPQFVILRNAAARRTGSGLETIGPRTAAAPTPPEPRVETHDMSLRDAVDATRDPGVAAIAIPMPTKFIKPFDVAAESAAAGDAWGIAAVTRTWPAPRTAWSRRRRTL